MAIAGIACGADVTLQGDVKLSESSVAAGDNIKLKDNVSILVDTNLSINAVDPASGVVPTNITFNFTSDSTLTVTDHFCVADSKNNQMESLTLGFIVQADKLDNFVESLMDKGSITHTIITGGQCWEIGSGGSGSPYVLKSYVQLNISDNLKALGYTASSECFTSVAAAEAALKDGEFALVQENYNKPMMVYGKAIPEPTTATLSLLALAGLAARRRRR